MGSDGCFRLILGVLIFAFLTKPGHFCCALSFDYVQAIKLAFAVK